MPKSPREVRREIQEAVTEQVRDLPIHAVRLAMFGVGRVLLLSDRVSRDYKELRESGVGPVLERLRGDAKHLSGQVVGKVVERVNGSNGTNGSVRTPERDTPVARPPHRTESEISVGKPATAQPSEPVKAFTPAEPAKPAPAPASEPAKPAPAPASEPAKPAPTKPSPAEPATTTTQANAAADLPVPDYDAATLASVRARLRTLSAAQVSKLRSYEQAHANRPEFVRMYDNRIAKLTQQA
jgi:hypothetical protein